MWRHHHDATRLSVATDLHPASRFVRHQHRVRCPRAFVGETGQVEGTTHRAGPRGETPVRRSRSHRQSNDHRPRRTPGRRSVHSHHHAGSQIRRLRHVVEFDSGVGAVHRKHHPTSTRGHRPTVRVTTRPSLPQTFVASGHRIGQFGERRMLMAQFVRSRLVDRPPPPHMLDLRRGARPLPLVASTSRDPATSSGVPSPHDHRHQRGHHRHRGEGRVSRHQTEQSGGDHAGQQHQQPADGIVIHHVVDRGGLRGQRVRNRGCLPRSRWRSVERSRCHRGRDATAPSPRPSPVNTPVSGDEARGDHR